jgi:hypothetical protein
MGIKLNSKCLRDSIVKPKALDSGQLYLFTEETLVTVQDLKGWLRSHRLCLDANIILVRSLLRQELVRTERHYLLC